MAELLVLVNGLPGSGKTSLAVGIARALPAALVSKDAIKEAVADAIPSAPSSALGAAAMDMAWTLTASIPGPVVLESWWFRPRDLAFAEAGVRACGASAVVELWCDVPAQLARDRYEARQRHQIHNDSQRLAESWSRWAAEAEPLGLGRTIRVATDRRVDIDAVTAGVLAAFG